jgi:hypothetical protein
VKAFREAVREFPIADKERGESTFLDERMV